METVSFTDRDIRALAAAGSYERARRYLTAVTGLTAGDDWATATVRGNAPYSVKLTLSPGLAGECDCPHGAEGNFCKHCVAVALTLLDGEQLPPDAGSLAAWLDGMTRQQLRGLLDELLCDEPSLVRRLEVRAAAAGADQADEAIRVRVADLLDVGWVEYEDLPWYARQVREVADAIRSLTSAGRPGLAAEVAEDAIELLDHAYEQVEDAGGYVAMSCDELADAHREACLAGTPDIPELAGWLVGRALNLCAVVAADPLAYAEVLGEGGMALLGDLARQAWQRDPAGWQQRALLESVLRAAGDVDGVVGLHAENLTGNGATHLVIACELDEAGRHDEALEWAERGLHEAGDEHVDQRLADYLTQAYERAGRLADALAVRKHHFIAQPSLGTYQRLRAAAKAAGCWRAERPAALTVLGGRAEPCPGWQSAGSALVAALIDDGDGDAGWQAAVDGRASQPQWLALADLVRQTRPGDALQVYMKQAEALRPMTGNEAYIRMARLLVKARECHARLGTAEEFRRYINVLRAELKRRRNLMAVLDKHGL